MKQTKETTYKHKGDFLCSYIEELIDEIFEGRRNTKEYKELVASLKCIGFKFDNVSETVIDDIDFTNVDMLK